MQQVTVSRGVAGIILTACLAIGVLVGLAANNNVAASRQPHSGLRGNANAEQASGFERRMLGSVSEVEARNQQTEMQERKLVRSPWDDLVWPDSKNAADAAVFDGWATKADEMLEIQRIWNNKESELDVLLEDDYSMSFSYNF